MVSGIILQHLAVLWSRIQYANKNAKRCSASKDDIVKQPHPKYDKDPGRRKLEILYKPTPQSEVEAGHNHLLAILFDMNPLFLAPWAALNIAMHHFFQFSLSPHHSAINSHYKISATERSWHNSPSNNDHTTEVPVFNMFSPICNVWCLRNFWQYQREQLNALIYVDVIFCQWQVSFYICIQED